jgi:hypothetical protein
MDEQNQGQEQVQNQGQETPAPVPEQPQRVDPEFQEYHQEMTRHSNEFLKSKEEEKAAERREKLLEQGLDDEGTWKSVGHQMAWEAESKLGKGWDGTGLNPFSYRDREEYDRDVERLHRIQEMVVAKKIADQPEPDRFDVIRDQKSLLREILRRPVGVISSKPEIVDLKEGIERAENEMKKFSEVLPYGEARFDNSPYWGNPIAQHNEALRVIDYNSKNDKNVVVLPAEITPEGDLEPIRPTNMRMAELPETVYENYREKLRNFIAAEKPDGDAILRESWRILRRLGYAESFTPTVLRGDAPRPVREPKTMKEFVEWRKKNNAKPW